jgi:hypothetical protein
MPNAQQDREARAVDGRDHPSGEFFGRFGGFAGAFV